MRRLNFSNKRVVVETGACLSDSNIFSRRLNLPGQKRSVIETGANFLYKNSVEFAPFQRFSLNIVVVGTGHVYLVF